MNSSQSLALDQEGNDLWETIKEIVSLGFNQSLSQHDRDTLALRIFRWQRSRCSAINRVAMAFGVDDQVDPQDPLSAIVGIPTDAYKTSRISCFSKEYTQRTFYTSGTTKEVKGVHEFANLDLYDQVIDVIAKQCLLPREGYRFVLLAQDPRENPHSSLGYMLERLWKQNTVDPTARPGMIENNTIAVERARASFQRSVVDQIPLAILGASFGFVHLHDALGDDEHWKIPDGSVIMPTGGFKGKSRELSSQELFDLIAHRWEVPRTSIVQEYGMTELTSHAYEHIPNRYICPPWMIVTAVDPESLAPKPLGEVGVLRVIDLANIGSCVAVQTADLGRVYADGFEVLGRVAGATPRGCARGIDAVLSHD